MLIDCDDLQSYFSTVLTASMSVDQLLSAKPDPAGSACIRREDGVWSIVDSTSKAAVDTWLATNNMSGVTAAQIGTLIPTTETRLGNVSLTPGEYALVMLQMHYDASYVHVYDQGQGPDVVPIPVSYSTATITQGDVGAVWGTVKNAINKRNIVPARVHVSTASHNSKAPSYINTFIQNIIDDDRNLVFGDIVALVKFDTGNSSSSGYLRSGVRIEIGRIACDNPDEDEIEIHGVTSDKWYASEDSYLVISVHNDNTSVAYNYSFAIVVPNDDGSIKRVVIQPKWDTSGNRTSLTGYYGLVAGNQILLNNYGDIIIKAESSSYQQKFDYSIDDNIVYGVLELDRVCGITNIIPAVTYDGTICIAGSYGNPDDGVSTYATDKFTINTSRKWVPSSSVAQYLTASGTITSRLAFDRQIQPIDFSQAVSVSRIAKAIQSTGDLLMSVMHGVVRLDSQYSTPQVGCYLGSVGNTAGQLSVTEYQDKSTALADAFISAVRLKDTFNADDFAGAAVTTALVNIIENKYTVFDSFFTMFADYTGYLICDTVITELMRSIVAGDEVSEVYNFNESSQLSIGGRSYTPSDIRNISNEDERQAVSNVLISVSDALDYRINLFDTLLKNYDVEASVTSAIQDIRNSIDEIRQKMMTIGTLQPSAASRALLLAEGKAETTYSKIQQALSFAARAGYTSIDDAIAFLNRSESSMGTVIDDPTQQSVMQQILRIANYDANLNCFRDPPSLSSSVNYWRSFQSRLGASILQRGSPDAEFATTPAGGMYLWPPVISGTVNSSVFDVNINKGSFFTIPLINSYVTIRKLSGNVYEIDWFARFSGGNDSDLIRAINACLREYMQLTSELASAYSGREVKCTIPTPNSGYKPGQYEATERAGELALDIAGGLAGAAIGASLTAPTGPGALVGAAGGFLIGVTGMDVVNTASDLFGDDANAIKNSDFSLESVVYNSGDLLESLKIEGDQALNSTGIQALRVSNALLIWAVRYGFYAPVGDYKVPGVKPVGIGVFSPTYVPPKYYFTGEEFDYSALILTASVALFAVSAVRYFKLEKVRVGSFIPAVVAGSAVSGMADSFATVSKNRVASESDIVQLADLITGDDEVTLTMVYNKIVETQSMLVNLDGLDQVNDKLDQLQADVTQVSTDVGTISTNVESVQSTLSDMSECCTSLQDSVQAISDAVEQLGLKLGDFIDTDVATELAHIKQQLDAFFSADPESEVSWLHMLNILATLMTVASGLTRSTAAIHNIVSESQTIDQQTLNNTVKIIDLVQENKRRLIRY